MDQKTDKLYPSAPLLENIDLEKRLEKKINDVNSFNNHISNIVLIDKLLEYKCITKKQHNQILIKCNLLQK